MADVAGDAARSAFSARLASVMESLLAAAVCEISRIFEGSLSASRQEVERGRQEVALLSRKLESLEGRLKAGVTFDPRAPDTGFGVGACLVGGPQADPLQGRGEAGQVKDELQVTEPESDGLPGDGAALERVHVKEESAGEEPDPHPAEWEEPDLCPAEWEEPDLRPAEWEEPEPHLVEGERPDGGGAPGLTTHLLPAADASLAAVADGTMRWTVIPGACPGPVLVQKLEEEPTAVAGLGCVPLQPLPSRPGCVTKGRGHIVLSPAPRHTHRNRHRPTLDHAPKPYLAGAHRPAPRTAPNHAHRPPPTAEGAPTNGWASEGGVPGLGGHETHALPTHPSPGGQSEGPDPEVGFVRSPPHSATPARRYHPNPVSKTTRKPPLGGGGGGGGRERPYGCPYCSKAFYYPSQQRRHLQRHTGQRLHPCALCDKSFVTPSELSVHVRVHTGEKPYACARCGKRFNRTGNLRAHERDVHLGKRPFSCAECGKTFAQKGNLRTHMQRVHQALRHMTQH